MNKILILLFTPILLAGCAISSERARGLSEYGLCSAYLDCGQEEANKTVLKKEIRRRGIACREPGFYGVSCEQISRSLNRLSNIMQESTASPF